MLITIFELFYVSLFCYFIIKYYKEGEKRQIFEMTSIAIFALTLEYLTIKAYEAYSYSEHFLFQFGSKPDNVPIVIALAWSLIISISMKFSDNIKINEKNKPFLDTMTALTIDLSMDAIAIRIEGGMWSWNQAISNNVSFANYLGVRYGNFIGWYLIVLIFSFLLRFGRIKNDVWSNFRNRLYGFTIPFLAFLPFYCAFELIQQLKSFFDYPFYFPGVVILLFILAFFMISRNSNLEVEETTTLYVFEVITFYSFHIFFIVALLLGNYYIQAPMLIISSIFALIIHFYLHRNFFFSVKHQIKSKFMIVAGE